MFVVLSGHVRISRRDGLGHGTTMGEQGTGQFLAEVGQLSGHPALVDGDAVGTVEALLIPPAFVQAQKFGAMVAVPSAVARLECAQNPLTLDLEDGRTVVLGQW